MIQYKDHLNGNYPYYPSINFTPYAESQLKW